MNNTVSTQWLADNLDRDDLIVIDASMQKVIGIEPIVYSEPAYIPKSVKMDLEQEFIGDEEGVHPFPSAEKTARLLSTLGVTTSHKVVVYDNQGLYSAPRAWWILTAFGFKDVSILQGGLPKWLQESRPVTSMVSDTSDSSITPTPETLGLKQGALTTAQEIVNNLATPNFTVVDVRGAPRFAGHAKEPREGVRSGHIPSSINLPFALLVQQGQVRSIEELQAAFAQVGLNPESKLVFSCGSGVTACIALYAATIAGFTQLSLYDGSWSEWGSNHELPINTL
jgi:thiosulfate/3-mercaptopyruvate sulfurtransferase